jgi:ZIP family zinc transporter
MSLVQERAAAVRSAPPVGLWLALSVLAVGGATAGWSVWEHVVRPDPKVTQALWGGLVAAAATAIGTLPAVFSHRTSDRARDAMLGFGAGVMLAASAFSLVVPALKAAQSQGAGAWGSAGIVGAGILLGAAMLLAFDHWLPHEHFIKGIERAKERALALKRTWLFVFAIALHNVPEGIAIGVGFAGNDPLTGGALATGIAIQDVPEGLVIALALRSAGYGRGLAVGLGAASGLVEPMGAVLGAAVIRFATGLLPWGLAFAAGAMLFVISHEMIPESHRQGHERHATVGLMIGFVLMMVLDTALG